MSRRKKVGAEAPPPKLWSLTGEQARLLREARDRGPEGVYLSACGTPGSAELLDGGAAEVREVAQSGGTRSAQDPRPCEWTDRYLLPTAYGLQLLAEHEAREAAEKERKRLTDSKRRY